MSGPAQPNISFHYEADGKWQQPPGDEVNSLAFIARELGPGFEVEEVRRRQGPKQTHEIAVKLPNDVVVSARLVLPGPPSRPPISAWSLFTFALVFLPLVFFWAAWTLSRQLNKFARAAETLLEGGHQPLPESGPEEIQQVARALNRMRDRIAGLLSDRTRMLSAIGHDLRTPITRLRLRAEFVEDEHIRLDILKDLDRMNRMVNSALTYIRDGLDVEAAVPVDLPALLRTVGDNFTDVGEQVSYEGAEHLSITARPDALVRAVENLVENPLKYGSKAVLRTGRTADDGVFIEVEDTGSALPRNSGRRCWSPSCAAMRPAAARRVASGSACRSPPRSSSRMGANWSCRPARWAACWPHGAAGQ